MENLRVRRTGYVFRRNYRKFLDRYKVCSKRTWPRFNGSARDGCMALMEDLSLPSNEFAFGRSMV